MAIFLAKLTLRAHSATVLSIHVKDSTAIDYNVSLVVAKVQEILTWAKKRVLIEHTLSDP